MRTLRHQQTRTDRRRDWVETDSETKDGQTTRDERRTTAIVNQECPESKDIRAAKNGIP